MNNKRNQLINLLKEDLGLFSSISFGIFLFILFFQPFSIDSFDIDNKLLIIAGLGVIVFLFMVLTRIVFPWFIHDYDQSSHEPVFYYFLGGFILFALTSTAFAFYLHYVAFADITFHIMFKVALVCLAPPVVLTLYDNFKNLKHENQLLINEKNILQKQLEKYEGDQLNKTIEFISESGKESLKLIIANVAFIQSADNYIEIAYKEDDNIKKKLIRNTLKNIEQQIKPYSNFIRCHRTCIVNTLYIEKLNRDYYRNWLSIKGYDQPIPVSLQYLAKLKETL